MPRDANYLGDVREQAVEISSEPWRLIAKHGADMRLPELLTTLADCEKARSFSVYDRCKAKFVRFSFRA